MKNLFWTGPRESDIAYTGDMFEASATYYGSAQRNNSSFCRDREVRINHNIYNEEASRFILNWQMNKIREHPECRFMSYNPNCVIGAPEDIVRRTLCLNDEKLMVRLNNKLEFRKLAEGLVPILDVHLLKGKDCTWSMLTTIDCFQGYDSFVIQEAVSSGGQGTFLMTEQNSTQVLLELQENIEYLVSGYLVQNIPVNVHAVIYDNDIVLLPASIQIIRPGNYRLLYRGADYMSFKSIPEKMQETFASLSHRLAQKLQHMGYRGVLGLDAMICRQKLYFLEINNRFQGSSILINKALADYGMKCLQQMNYDAFYEHYIDIEEKKQVEGIKIPYSLYTFLNEMNGIHPKYIMETVTNEKTMVAIEGEGYVPAQKAESYASLFAVLFNTNILSLFNSGVRLHPNLSGVSEEWDRKIKAQDWTAIKTAVLNRGAILSRAATQFIDSHGKMRLGTYYSLDLYTEGIYINCPLYVKFTALSPFTIDVNEKNDGLCIKYYGKYLLAVGYDVKHPFPKERLSNGTAIEQICFLATDRLRLQNNSYCTFSAHKCSCRFCEADGIYNNFSENEILEAIDTVFSVQPPIFRHILIGGLSNDRGKERSVILHMCKKIREYTDMPIYLMCLPPDKDDVVSYYEAGVNEFGFNLEIYDRNLAKKYMPGKGYIPLKRYFDALEAAVACTGRHGTVRCAFIAGLEPMDSLLEGIEEICRRGAAPVLSVFRPIPGSAMQDVIPPSDEWLYDLTLKATAICRRYGLFLGPECPACRNNTLSIAMPGETEQLLHLGWKRE